MHTPKIARFGLLRLGVSMLVCLLVHSHHVFLLGPVSLKPTSGQVFPVPPLSQVEVDLIFVQDTCNAT